MLSRRSLLAFSFVISVTLHAAVLLAAPRIPVVFGKSSANLKEMPFRVHLRETEKEPPPEPVNASTALTSRTSAVEDLLERDNEELTINESLGDTSAAEAGGLAQRAATTDTVERSYDLAQNLEEAKKVDAKILEISQNDARRDIEVTRRIVRPSVDRIVAADEFPVVRGAGEDDRGAERLALGTPVTTTLHNQAVPPSNIVANEKAVAAPLPEPEVIKQEIVDAKAPALEGERLAARAPLLEEARGESAYEFFDDVVDIKIDAFQPAGEEKGYFRLRIAPKDKEAIEVLPKDVTFVVDSSASIPQHKLDMTTKSVARMIGELRPQDQFNIVSFRDNPALFRPARVAATEENKAAGGAFVTALLSRGQTDVYQGIRSVLTEQPRPGVPGVVLVMTDGRPTSGMKDGRAIINALTADNTLGNTIFAYGGGNTVNRYLLDLLAYRNKGESFVSPRLTDIAKDLPGFFGDVNDPLLVNLQSDYGQIDDDAVFPRQVPDFYRGRAVTVYGRFDPKKDKEFSMRLTGAAGNRRKELVFKADLGKAASGDKDIARNWAFQKCYYLIGEICRTGETPELLDELHRLSREYDIKTSYSE